MSKIASGTDCEGANQLCDRNRHDVRMKLDCDSIVTILTERSFTTRDKISLARRCVCVVVMVVMVVMVVVGGVGYFGTAPSGR